MSYLLDTNICSTYMRRRTRLFHRFVQHSGRLWISSIGLSELYAWAYKQDNPSPIRARIDDFLRDVGVLPFEEACALRLGQLRGALLRQGTTISPIDLMIAAVALEHDLTLVTHNTKDFARIPDLRLEDWLEG